MELLSNLERLEIVSRVLVELSNHLNLDDKDLAEYVVHLGSSSPSKDAFSSALLSDGLEASSSLVSSLFTLTRPLYVKQQTAASSAEKEAGARRVSLSDLENVANTEATADSDPKVKRHEKAFPGLCIPDNRNREELRFSRPDDNAPLSRKAQALLDEEKTDRQRLEDLKEEKKKEEERRRNRDRQGRHSGEAQHRRDQQRSPLSRREDVRRRRSSPSSLSREGRSSRRRRSRDEEEHRDSRRRSRSREDDRAARKRDSSSGSQSPSHFRSKRGRSNDDNNNNTATHRKRPHNSNHHPQPLELNSIFDGEVSRVMDYGAFVSFFTADQGRKEGLVHVGDVQKGPMRRGPGAIEGLLSRGQKVKVKVVGIAGSKLTLSMRDVDQVTGEDLKARREAAMKSRDELKSGTATADTSALFNPTNPSAFRNSQNRETNVGAVTGILLDQPGESRRSFAATANKKRKHLTDLEIFENQQMQASGVLPVQENLQFDEEAGGLQDAEPTVEELEVEVEEVEPVFLKGQTSRTGAILSPIRVVSNPDGSLARAAATASALSKERREVKDQQEKSLLEWIPKDMNRPWEDPNPEPGERTIAQALRGIGQGTYEMPEWKSMFIGKSISYGQRSTKPIKEQRESLPIFSLRNQLLKAIRDNQVLIVIGETGSGKTTQMTQYLAESGYTSRGMIGSTQPRRVAAMSVAKRVAEEFGCRLGQEIGYSIRFEDCTSNDTLIKYMTDGMLLREALVDPLLTKYSVIMLDEAHERTISTDVLFGLLKDTCRKRPEFKLIVTSATLDAEKFSSYFFHAHIFTIPGRTYPVEILYSKEPESDYIEAALITVLQIHLCEPPGDVLLFLTGQEEIDTACQTLHERMQKLESMQPPPLIILPVYSALPSEMQTMIFEPAPPGCRKCIVATNIAEASLTIDGIYFVVDPGFAKVKVYSPKTGMDSLVVVPISQANARQRSGRAGRTGPGKCFRLYTENAYRNEMLPTAVPELQRTNLSNTVLLLKAMGVNDLIHFDFMDPPPVQTLINAMEHLYQLGALDEEGLMTRLGRKMAEFPMEPSMSKMLLTSVDLKCSDEVISVAALLQVQNIFYRPRDKQALAEQKKAKFHQSEGDHVTYLEVYKAWQRNRFSNPWCYENFIQARALRRAQDVRKQLISIMDRYKLDIVSCGKNYTLVQRAICSGFFRHACKRDPQEGYRTLVENAQVYLHPSGSLYNRNPEWIIYHELVMTTKEYLRDCCLIDPQWLIQLAPHLFKKADESRLSRRKQREKIEPLFNRFEEPNAWRLSRRRI